MAKKKLKIFLLSLLSFVLSVAPVMIYFFINMGRYTKTVPETVKLAGGGIILLVIVALKAFGHLKIQSRAVAFGLVFLLSYLLEAILNDLIVFSFLALVGELLEAVISIPIKRMREDIIVEKTASKTAEKIDEAVKRYFRGESV